MAIQILLVIATMLYQAIACWREDRQTPPGQLLDVGGYRLHLLAIDEGVAGEGRPTMIVESSLGGVEGYLLLEELAKLGRVCVYDRAGYGWSDHSLNPRSSYQIVQELDALLTRANIEPPYLLIGDSFGSYSARLYAHQFPEKVAGLVLTDGLHETGMLKMSIALQALKLFFISGFVMSTIGSSIGIVRLLEKVGMFEFLKPELRRFSKATLYPVKRSFCRPKHWITMSREMFSLDVSARQASVANQFGTLPIATIKAASFFKPAIWTGFVPLKGANALRDRMHDELLKLSSDCVQLQAEDSAHFVWVDRPDVIIDAVKIILSKQ